MTILHKLRHGLAVLLLSVSCGVAAQGIEISSVMLGEPQAQHWVASWGASQQIPEPRNSLPAAGWIEQVCRGVTETNARYPFIAYGTDWLAFAHLVIAVAFIGPWIDPVRNKWVITFGLIACAGVIPVALIAGPIRGVPIGWRLIDCGFGVIGSIPLLLCRRHIRELEKFR